MPNSSTHFNTLASFDLVIDARSPREFEEDHLPGSVNLPVVNNEEYAEVGTLHRVDPLRAYQIGVAYSLKNIARHLELPFFRTSKRLSILVYCARGGKRSRLWADALDTIGYHVSRLPDGWKGYRKWVRDTLGTIPATLRFNVLSGPTGCGKTILLQALDQAGAQTLDLEALAVHRGSVIGGIPGHEQPSQKLFDSRLLERLCSFNVNRPVWIESESKRIGRVQLPTSLFEEMHRSKLFTVRTPMRHRVAMWRREYPHFEKDPIRLVNQLSFLKPIVGGAILNNWAALAEQGFVDDLFERVMTDHYDPAYTRSTEKHYCDQEDAVPIELLSLDEREIKLVAQKLVDSFQ
jgi:tRNA 2-selenouridine synthase